MRHSFVVAALGTAAFIIACGSGTTTTNVVTEYAEAGARTSGYTVTFPSTAAAVATDTVQVLVFDASDTEAGSTCAALIEKRKSNVDLPQPLASSTALTPCALGQDLDGSAGGAVTIPFGPVAVLVVATREGKDFLLGCTNAVVSGTSEPVNVSLSLASSAVSVPVSTCPDLGTHCATKC